MACIRDMSGVWAIAARCSRTLASSPPRADEDDELWTLTDAGNRRFRAPVVVNAAGAWVDVVAAMHGVPSIGVRPMRRTIFTVNAPTDVGRSVPMTCDLGDTFYIKPENDQFLCSPAEETLQQPHDPRPDELQVARAIEAINEATILDIRHVRTSWAGLRNFAPDRLPVVGYDPQVAGFFWLAGQGGYGIQTAPAMARLAASLVRGDGADLGIDDQAHLVAAIDPARLRHP